MSEITLESLAARIAALEKRVNDQLAAKPEPPKDWRKSVGLFDDDPDFEREVVSEILAIRDAEREAARRGVAE
ncbi:MAG: hypothetical protein KF873_11220 [Gemmataceae bacterium]|nr:hypothetical protein [Planctomycetia bacterium]MBX3399304.1 hypothetical protein [Gemmataceae bacterium]